MTIFDLLFIALVLVSLATIVTAAIAAIRGQRTRALGILLRFGVSVIAYLAIVVVVALLSPRRVLNVGDP